MTASRRTSKDIATDMAAAWQALVDIRASDLEEWDEADAFNPGLVRRRRELVVLAGAAPRAAVLEAWADVERSLRAAGQRWGLAGSATAYRTVQELPPASGVGAAVKTRIDELRRVRNAAAHASSDIAASVAAEFVVLALQISVHVDFVTDTTNDVHFQDGWRESLTRIEDNRE